MIYHYENHYNCIQIEADLFLHETVQCMVACFLRQKRQARVKG